MAANLTGLRVDYYALVDFRGFVEMVDALGGVTVTVTRPVLDRVSPPEEGDDWIRIDLPAGRRHLDADQAFAYVRARRRVLPDLIRLVSGVDRHRVLSLGFTPPDDTTGFVGPGAAARGARNLGGEVCG